MCRDYLLMDPYYEYYLRMYAGYGYLSKPIKIIPEKKRDKDKVKVQFD